MDKDKLELLRKNGSDIDKLFVAYVDAHPEEEDFEHLYQDFCELIIDFAAALSAGDE